MSELTASAPISEPMQKTTTPPSITFLRPNKSPSVPAVSMKAANTRAYASTTHWSWLTPAWRLDCTAAKVTLTMVLSRKVRNSTTNKVARPR